MRVHQLSKAAVAMMGLAGAALAQVSASADINIHLGGGSSSSKTTSTTTTTTVEDEDESVEPWRVERTDRWHERQSWKERHEESDRRKRRGHDDEPGRTGTKKVVVTKVKETKESTTVREAPASRHQEDEDAPQRGGERSLQRMDERD